MRGDTMEFLNRICALMQSRRGFSGIMLMSILSILVGAVVLLITYLVLSTVIDAVVTAFVVDNTPASVALNLSLQSNIGVINSALTLVGIMLIGAGALGLIYMFGGLGGAGMGRRGM